jgi:predicted ester cyclase
MSATADHARSALEEVCARGDLACARELYAEDFIDHVNALEFHGQEGIAKSVALYRAVFPDLRIRVEDQTVDGDRVTSRWTLQGTHKGRKVMLPGITISRFENGRIAEDWTVSDNLELLRRLGVRPGLALAARQLDRELLVVADEVQVLGWMPRTADDRRQIEHRLVAVADDEHVVVHGDI